MADPACAALNQRAFPRGQRAAVHHVRPDRAEHLGKAAGIDKRDPWRDRHHLAFRRDRVFGVAAADQQGADSIAGSKARAALAKGSDGARDFEPHQIGRAGRHRIFALAFAKVGPVDAGGADLDQNLARAGCRQGAMVNPQGVGPARRVGTDHPHHGGKLVFWVG